VLGGDGSVAICPAYRGCERLRCSSTFALGYLRRTLSLAVHPTGSHTQHATRGFVIAGAVAGIVAPVLLAAVFIALTLVERGFLHRAGWSAIRRTEVEWPSLLERGPQGLVLQVAFVSAGALGVMFSSALWITAKARREKAGAVSLAALSVAVSFMAFPPDLPAAHARSWQDVVHNSIYPAVPITALLAAIAYGAVRGPVDDRWRGPSRVFLVVAIAALSVTLVAGAAQLARFVFFAALLGWIAYISWLELAASTSERNSADSRCSTS
jgi:hypothetical protein